MILLDLWNFSQKKILFSIWFQGFSCIDRWDDIFEISIEELSIIKKIKKIWFKSHLFLKYMKFVLLFHSCLLWRYKIYDTTSNITTYITLNRNLVVFERWWHRYKSDKSIKTLDFTLAFLFYVNILWCICWILLRF